MFHRFIYLKSQFIEGGGGRDWEILHLWFTLSPARVGSGQGEARNEELHPALPNGAGAQTLGTSCPRPLNGGLDGK